MKKIFLIVLLIIGVIYGSNAQDQGIRFEKTKEWKKVLKKAKREKKLIFVDCYTSWCGPCKRLAQEVFPLEKTGTFFNENFVNVKYDMDQDTDGVMLKKQFNVNGYPTLIFVDPESGNMVHQIVGAGSAEQLLREAELAKDSQNNVAGMRKRHEAGEKDIVFLRHYLERLDAANLFAEQENVAIDYLNALPEDEFFSKENWKMIEDNIKDPLSRPLRLVMEKRTRFYDLVGKEAVDKKINQAMIATVQMFFVWKPIKSLKNSKVADIRPMTEFDEARNMELIKYLSSIDYSNAPAFLTMLLTAGYIREGDMRGMWGKMKEAAQYNLFGDKRERFYLSHCVQNLLESNDKELIKDVVAWFEKQQQELSDGNRKVFYGEYLDRLKIQGKRFLE